jgi:DNA-binding IclR family transcriptional regulator
VRLSCSAAGHAWLASLSDEQALALVARQGLGQPQDFGPRAPKTLAALQTHLRATRSRGYSMISDMFAPAMASMGAPVVHRGRTLGVVTIAGPMVRLTEARMVELGGALRQTADEIAGLSASSSLFRQRAA